MVKVYLGRPIRGNCLKLRKEDLGLITRLKIETNYEDAIVIALKIYFISN